MTGVETQRSIRSAIHQLREMQKTSRGVPAYTLWVNRRLGRVVAAVAYRMTLTPNAVTVIGAMMSGAACVLIAAVHTGLFIAFGAALLFVLGYVLDSADGQLARLTERGSSRGEWLDHVLDASRSAAIHSCVLIGLYRFSPLAAGWLLVPIAYQVIATTLFCAGLLADKLLRQRETTSSPRDRGLASRWRPWVMLPVDYGVLCLVFFLWYVPWAFLFVYGILALASALVGAALLNRWWRELAETGSTAGN